MQQLNLAPCGGGTRLTLQPGSGRGKAPQPAASPHPPHLAARAALRLVGFDRTLLLQRSDSLFRDDLIVLPLWVDPVPPPWLMNLLSSPPEHIGLLLGSWLPPAIHDNVPELPVQIAGVIYRFHISDCRFQVS